MDRFTGGFSSDSTWTIHGDYGLFGISDTRDNSILSEFGWNFQQPPPEFDRIDYGGCCGVPKETNPTTNAVAVQSQAGSVENTGDVSVSNPLVSSSSFEDRPETLQLPVMPRLVVNLHRRRQGELVVVVLVGVAEPTIH
ncbi:hypothetical protein L6452_35585 [Arctium lappa]|uniref:Uncharacterized protein n=1 Tax=Arctium lappa TaxID=4217 RepID=A0ACB8Y6Y7_ARCLA|nr:hypothetical protein L6452_35585 [Arctium lappa]